MKKHPFDDGQIHMASMGMSLVQTVGIKRVFHDENKHGSNEQMESTKKN